MSKPRFSAVFAACAIGLCALTAPLTANASGNIPATLGVSGSLRTSGGGAVADGSYTLTFRLYDALSAKTELFKEIHVAIPVKSGMFSTTVGGLDNKNLLDATVFNKHKASWLGVQVAGDPELPRARIDTVPYAFTALHSETATSVTGPVDGASIKASSVPPSALAGSYAASSTPGGPAKSALSISCTGCIQMDAILWGKDLSLPKHNIVANKVSADNMAAGSIAAGKIYGDGSSITGLAIPSGTCKGEDVVWGVNADGSLRCKAVKFKVSGDLLKAASNGTLTTTFGDSFALAGAPFPIPDNNPKGLSQTIEVPDLGVCTGFSTHLVMTSSDLSNVMVRLDGPGGLKFLLIGPGTGKGTQLSTVFPNPSKPTAGDFGGAIGKNLKGTWKLTVVDGKFTNNKTDGELVTWRLGITYQSATKVKSTGKLVTAGGTDHGWNSAAQFRLGPCPEPAPKCDATMVGALCAHPKTGGLTYCNGNAWSTVGGTAATGTQGAPATSCKSLLADAPTSKSGLYWLDPDAAGSKAPFQAYCDMTTAGGGWTMCVTDNQSWRVRSEAKFAGTYGKDGYRTNCLDVPFRDILYVRNSDGAAASFRRDKAENTTFSKVGGAASWNVGGGVLGAFSRLSGPQSATTKYQATLCDNAWMTTGLAVTGNSGCAKECGSWCSDTTSAYFRYDGDNGGSYNGVAFNENGHKNLSDKLMSVGIR